MVGTPIYEISTLFNDSSPLLISSDSIPLTLISQQEFVPHQFNLMQEAFQTIVLHLMRFVSILCT